MANKRKGTKRRFKYSVDQKKAYYMGYGIGTVSGRVGVGGEDKVDFAIHTLCDPRQGSGQRKDLCDSMFNGYEKGKKNRNSVHFDKTKKKFPVSFADYIKD